MADSLQMRQLPSTTLVGRRVLTPPHTAFRRGVTLVELMISMLILAIVCISWLQIIGIQSARKEARRREAVERLSGMMDAFMYMHRAFAELGSYSMTNNVDRLLFTKDGDAMKVHPMFEEDVSPIGYRLEVVEKKDLPRHEWFGNNWDNYHVWLVGSLYHSHGAVVDVGKPFFTLPVCLGVDYEPPE